DDARVPARLLRPLRVPEEIRVVALLPDQHEVGRGHEVGDELASGSRTRKRIGRHALPAAVVVAVLDPELPLGGELLIFDRYASRLELLHPAKASDGVRRPVLRTRVLEARGRRSGPPACSATGRAGERLWRTAAPRGLGANASNRLTVSSAVGRVSAATSSAC